MAILFAIANILPFRSIDAPPGLRPRISTLDALRGFLAFGVFFHHGAIYHRYIDDGIWTTPPSAAFNLFGQVGVSIFFMITGYLFWSRILTEYGRPNWVSLYTSRIFRIGPLYLVAVGAMLAVVFASTDLQIREPTFQLFRNVSRWCLLGFVRGSDVNGYENPGRILADVTWTLRYEWWFYLSLPLIALVLRSFKAHFTIFVIGLMACLIYLSLHPTPGKMALTAACVSLFLLGMCCASLERKGLMLPLPDWIKSGLVVVILVSVFSFFETAYFAFPILLLGIVFYLIISGSSVFGLLLTRPARRLGDISYGIYLLQGIVLYFVFTLEPIRVIALASPALHWIVIGLCALLLMTLAAVTHHLIELPGIRLGKSVAAAIQSYFSTKSAAA
jgi:peptidoglycan/LPS O-acetylase OafA/YrhL